jgi:hypothetical protein
MPLFRIVLFPDLSLMSIRERDTGASRCLGLAKGLKHTRYFRRTLEAIGCLRERNEDLYSYDFFVRKRKYKPLLLLKISICHGGRI